MMREFPGGIAPVGAQRGAEAQGLVIRLATGMDCHLPIGIIAVVSDSDAGSGIDVALSTRLVDPAEQQI